MKLSDMEYLIRKIKNGFSENEDPDVFIEVSPDEKVPISGIYTKEASIRIH